MRRFLDRVLTRLRAAAGLVRAGEVERIRRAVRAGERRRAERKAAAMAARIEGLRRKARAAHARAAGEHVRHRTVRALFRHYLIRLARIEDAFAARVALDRRVQRAQLMLAVKDARGRSMSPAARAESARLMALSPVYEEAVSRWRSRRDDAWFHRVTIAGLRWSAPADTADPQPSAPRTIESWLPVDDLTTVRRFTVGGLMLDIGAGIGATSVPRVLLGDCVRAYAAEPDGRHYRCLVGNTLDNELEGRVMPDRIAVAGVARHVSVRGLDGEVLEEVEAMTADAWVERLGIDPDEVRFIRVALQEWNVDILRGAECLLKRRNILWQCELPDAAVRAGSWVLNELAGAIRSHFTHVKVLGRRWPQRWLPASETTAILNDLSAERRGGSLILFNLPDVDARERPAGEASRGREPRGTAVISLLHATARLPDGWRPAMEAFRARAKDPASVEYILAINDDESYSVPPETMGGWRRDVVVKDGVTGPNSGYNAAAKAATGDILMTIADDYYPPDGWDEQIREAIPDVAQEVVLDVENSDGVTHLLPFSFLTRRYYERYGYVLYPGYHGFFGDNEFTEQARRDGVIRRARHIVFEHRHPDRGTASMDAVYARQRSHFEEGKRLFRERKAKDFPTWPD